MELKCIVTMANNNTRLRFLAMERSLRSTGCTLPLLVIPYDDNIFDLPENSSWWVISEVFEWLRSHGCRGVYRKYQCLLIDNFQFVDADVVFLSDPANTLLHEDGWISSCGHWHNPGQTYSEESLLFFKKQTTTWQKRIFNTGQFACSKALYTFKELVETAESIEYIDTALKFRFHEQPGINQLVFGSSVIVNNLTLNKMESTWAGDYPDENYEDYWKEEGTKPYLIHWAGTRMDTGRPIDKEFLKFLTPNELEEWNSLVALESGRRNSFYSKCRRYLSKVKQAIMPIRFD